VKDHGARTERAERESHSLQFSFRSFGPTPTSPDVTRLDTKHEGHRMRNRTIVVSHLRKIGGKANQSPETKGTRIIDTELGTFDGTNVEPRIHKKGSIPMHC
jgi:hypothetical protein